MFIIKRDDGAMVADMRLSTTGSSYTRNLQQAKLFTTREEAERDRCPGNERVVDIGYNDILNRR